MDEFGKISTVRLEKRRQKGRIKLCLLFLCICCVLCAVFSSVIVLSHKTLGQNTVDISSTDSGNLQVENNVDVNNIDDDYLENGGFGVQKGSGAVVIEQTTKRVLYHENKDAKLYPASTTKVLTALVVLQQVPLDKKVKIPKEAVGIEGSSIYLREGETLTVKELLLGLMLRSGNDSAIALALAVSETVDEFVALMNSTAKSIGANNSNFKNPHGLHHDEHYTTAFDLALITAEAFNNPDFCKIVATKSAVLSGAEEKRYIQNKNKMLWQYEGANGVKTGYTKMSGRCLVSSAKRDNMQVIAVVLNHGAMWDDSKNIMNYAFNSYQMISPYKDLIKAVKVKNGKVNETNVRAEDAPMFPIKKDGSEQFEVEIISNTLNAPIVQGNECGTVKVSLSNRLIFEGKVYTMENVDKKTFRDKVLDFFGRKK